MVAYDRIYAVNGKTRVEERSVFGFGFRPHTGYATVGAWAETESLGYLGMSLNY